MAFYNEPEGLMAGLTLTPRRKTKERKRKYSRITSERLDRPDDPKYFMLGRRISLKNKSVRAEIPGEDYRTTLSGAIKRAKKLMKKHPSKDITVFREVAYVYKRLPKKKLKQVV